MTSGPYATSQQGHTQGCLRTPAALGSFSGRPCPSTALNDSSCETGVIQINFSSAQNSSGNKHCLLRTAISTWSGSKVLFFAPDTGMNTVHRVASYRPKIFDCKLERELTSPDLLRSHTAMAVALVLGGCHTPVATPSHLTDNCIPKTKDSYLL